MTKHKDDFYSWVIGSRFGKLTVTGLCKIKRPSGKLLHGLKCLCDCGNHHEATYYSLAYGSTTSCGCNYRLNLSGLRYGKLLVMERVTVDGRSNLFRCICDCGNEKIVIGTELKRGNYKSCGCNRTPRTTYNYRSHPLYTVWKGMKARCNDANHISYCNYGGRGVKVCEDWAKNFISFYEWALANGYKQGLNLDKDIIAKDKGLEANLYSPERCQFVSDTDNARASKRVKLSMGMADEIRNSELRRVDLARKFNINKSTVDKIKNNQIWKK